MLGDVGRDRDQKAHCGPGEKQRIGGAEREPSRKTERDSDWERPGPGRLRG